MAYTPDWERLSESLKRVTAAGVRKNKAKLVLSCLIADAKIRFRVTIGGGTCDITGTLTGANVKAPPHLIPDDFDWANSRPVKPWSTGPRDWKSDERHSFSWRNRPISLIEVRTVDLMGWLERTFPTGVLQETVARASNKPQEDSVATAGQEAAAIKALASHLKTNREMARADAEKWCRTAGYKLGKRAFARVWPEARGKADLTRIARPGRKPKPSH
jgi:hypothetical protein